MWHQAANTRKEECGTKVQTQEKKKNVAPNTRKKKENMG